ncbi:hypothetical protein EAE96_008542 [Botrytis aclada]|nr:hypothetical protein EAE96_008542 [Botrytis aclada]
MGFLSIITSFTPGDPRSRLSPPRREESGRGPSQRAPPFSPPRYEAPPSYESLSTASTRPEGVVSTSGSHRATAGPNSRSLVAPSVPSSRPQSSSSLPKERPHSSYTPRVDRRISQAASDAGRRSSDGGPDPSHRLANDRRHSTTGIRRRSEGTSQRQNGHRSTNVDSHISGTYNHSTAEASCVPRSSEQARVTTGFKAYDEWWNRSR